MSLRAISCHSRETDPYRAGLALGQQLAALAPEVVLVFVSIHYEQPAELLEALAEVLGPQVLILGNSGQGFYERDGCADRGVAALGLNAGGTVRWQLRLEEGLAADPADCARRCLAGFAADDWRLFFFGCDFRCDTSLLLSGLQGAGCPVVGGAAGDDYRMQRSFVLAGGRVVDDALVMLGAAGDLRCAVRLAQEMRQVGVSWVIEQAHDTRIERIAGDTALGFIAQQIGQPFLEMDQGVVCLRIESADGGLRGRMRSLMPASDLSSGVVRLYGGIAQGERVRCCVTNQEDLVGGMGRLDLDRLGFTPAAALVVSCAGRKQILGTAAEQEVAAVTRRLPGLAAIAGYPSFGEFAPLPEAPDGTLFHNMTCVVLLLGSGG